MTEDYITLREAGELMGCSPRTARRRSKRNGWQSYLDEMSGGTPVRKVRRQDVVQYVRDQLPENALDILAEDIDHVPCQSGPDDAAENAPVKASEVRDTVSQLTAALEDYTAAVREQTEHQRRRDRLALLVGVPVFIVVVGLCAYVLGFVFQMV